MQQFFTMGLGLLKIDFLLQFLDFCFEMKKLRTDQGTPLRIQQKGSVGLSQKSKELVRVSLISYVLLGE